jgi:transposase
MPRPLSNDLRERVVRAYLAEEGTAEQLAARFGVGTASVERWVARHRQTGSVAPKEMGGNRNGKFDASSEQRLRHRVLQQPDATLAELVQWLADELNLSVSDSAVDRALRRLGLVRKKRRSAPRRGTATE